MNNKNQIQQPGLRFSPTAWAKLLFMRDLTDNEVGGFGITKADDLLFVTDFVLIKQDVTSVTVSFDDDAVADFFADQVEAGIKPEQFARIWLHSHPGMSPQPSGTDEETFSRVFGSCDWAVMFIIASDGRTYARLRFNTGPGGEIKIPVYVDYSEPFKASDFKLWEKQYESLVTEANIFSVVSRPEKKNPLLENERQVFGNTDQFSNGLMSSEELINELEMLHPSERQAFMDELAYRSEFWDEYEIEVFYE